MKFWTIQSPKVLDIIENQEVYYPMFIKSQYYKQYSDLYDFILKAFNNNNKFNCEGVVYAFCVSIGGTIYSIRDVDAFRSLINMNRDKIIFLWNYFIENNCKIMELEINLKFNDLALPFNFFQYVMPSPINDLLFNKVDYQRNCESILSNIEKGIIMSSGEEYDLIQSHLPYIKKENVKNVYNLFELD